MAGKRLISTIIMSPDKSIGKLFIKKQMGLKKELLHKPWRKERERERERNSLAFLNSRK